MAPSGSGQQVGGNVYAPVAFGSRPAMTDRTIGILAFFGIILLVVSPFGVAVGFLGSGTRMRLGDLAVVYGFLMTMTIGGYLLGLVVGSLSGRR